MKKTPKSSLSDHANKLREASNQAFLDKIMKKQCLYPSLAAMLYHIATGYDELKACALADDYWQVISDIVLGTATPDTISAFIDKKAPGKEEEDINMRSVFKFLVRSDLAFKELRSDLPRSMRESMVQAAVLIAQDAYSSPGTINLDEHLV